MKKTVGILAVFALLCAVPFARAQSIYSGIHYANASNATAVFDAGRVTASNDGMIVYASSNIGSGNVLNTPTATGCGGVTFYPIDSFQPALAAWQAYGLPANCTGANVATSLGGVGPITVAVIGLHGYAASYFVENYSHQFIGTTTVAPVTTTGVSDLLISATIDTSGSATFSPSGGFSTIQNQSANVPVMQVSTNSGGPGTYSNSVSGCSGVNRCFQIMIAVRSVLPAFGMTQFSHLQCTSSVATTTQTLPLPPLSGDMIYHIALPYGSGDLPNLPGDNSGTNHYVQIGSVLPTNNGGGEGFYEKNLIPPAGGALLTISDSNISGGTASTYCVRTYEVHGADPVDPYSGSLQDGFKNYPVTTNFKFGPVTLPPGNYLMIGTAFSNTEVPPYTVTNGVQYGGPEVVSNGLTNGFGAQFTSTGASFTMTVTPTSGQPYGWFAGIFSDTTQTQGKDIQSSMCSYGCLPTGALKTLYPVTPGSTVLVWAANTNGTALSLASSLDTLHVACAPNTSNSAAAWYITNATGGARYTFTPTGVGQSGFHYIELSNVNASSFEAASCGGGSTAGGIGTQYNSGSITTSHTDVIIGCGGFAGAFGDQPVVQDGSWPQSLTSQYSDYIGAQCSITYDQVPGMYSSANYYTPSNSGTLGAGIFAFNNSFIPGPGTTSLKAKAIMRGAAAIK